MQRRIVAQEVAQKLGALERHIDQTLVAAGALIAALPDARVRARLSAVVGQDALDLVAQATVILSQARGKMVEAHNALAITGHQIGVGKIVAELGDKPVPPPPSGELDTPMVVYPMRAA
ncbi:MAG: hypothetical protein JWO33_1723 [Caulobacteraceae bacterium]|nr:hypothetical protein [Caulobacteraceae bacterium]